MIKFNKPENLNGQELIEELELAGITVTPDYNNIKAPLIDGNGDLWLDINLEKELEAALIVASHNGTTAQTEPTIADKLALVGLSIEELRTAILGGN